MGWIQELYKTYNNCQSLIGYTQQSGKRALLPICHMSKNADIEVTLDLHGNFRAARIIYDQSEDAITIIPTTEGSASRSGSKPECHPLCGELQYVAGDFTKFGGLVTSGFQKDPTEPYRNYVKILTRWCVSKWSHAKAQAVLKYVSKKSLIQDLVNNQILLIESNGKLQAKSKARRASDRRDIFAILNNQDTAFVRWIVESPGDKEPAVWRDSTLWDSWIHFYLDLIGDQDVCYVTGQLTLLTNNHPKYIRSRGDGAKLISSNDKRGFTYLGRFVDADQACGVSLEASQKAHNALRWLIDRQGKVFFIESDGRWSPGLTVLAWVASGNYILQLTDDAADLLGFEELEHNDVVLADTGQNIALKLRRKISGYFADIQGLQSVQVIALNAASKGRLAVTYYQELHPEEYLKQINEWHESCAWRHSYRYRKELNQDGKEINRYYLFVGAPAPHDIAEAAYGNDVDERLKQSTVLRILPCIVEGRPIPRDLVELTVRRACNPTSMEPWEWNKTLTIACALFRKYNKKENYAMTLDPNRKTRDYLYGRLLALADSLEEWALSAAGEKRDTNAARLMQRFAEHPFSTWRTIELSLAPYKARLGGKSNKRQRMIDEVVAAFKGEDFISDKPLSGEFLLGYHCQRQDLRSAFEADKNSEDQDTSDL